MSTATQVTTFSDLYTDLMNRAREETSLTATVNQAKRYINIALHDMHVGQGEKFPWAERTAFLNTRAQYTTGTVSATQGSVTVTGSSTAWITNDAFGWLPVNPGGKIVINGADEVYEVLRPVNNTSLTLKSDFIQSDVSDASYVYFEDEYELAQDFLRPIDQQKFDAAGNIDLVGRTEFRRRYPANKTPNRPSVATIGYRPVKVAETGTITAVSNTGDGRISIAATNTLSAGDRITISGTNGYYDGDHSVSSRTPLLINIYATFVATDTGTYTRNATQVKTIRFHPPPSEVDMIRYQYVTSNFARTSAGVEQAQLVNDTDEPIVPLQYRHAIVLHALARWYRDKKDDARAVDVFNEYARVMTGVIGDTEIGGARAQFRPRVGIYKRRARRPWGGGSGRYDLNGRFDRME